MLKVIKEATSRLAVPTHRLVLYITNIKSLGIRDRPQTQSSENTCHQGLLNPL
jgi:hypothetical protein